MESLIAIVILGIVMAGGIAFYYRSNMLYNRGLHSQLATWVADSKMEEIKSAGCSATTADAGSSVAIDKLTGIRKITWPTSAAQDPCSVAAPTTKTCAASPPTVVGVCVTWTEPGEIANSSKVGLVTYVGS